MKNKKFNGIYNMLKKISLECEQNHFRRILSTRKSKALPAHLYIYEVILWIIEFI